MEGRRVAAVLIVTICMLALEAGALRDPPLCNLLPDMGPCLAHMERFYFDRFSKECKVFIYGGCPGNANNFPTAKECYKRCGNK
uniref:G037_VD_Conkunitzin_precursor_conopeptide n=1 Tax=Conus geographus TaxID=6491 RepID=X5IXY6_CONGE|nr:G037_VD_Conkunitzin_precursor_conopeptide [Conus geographus]